MAGVVESHSLPGLGILNLLKFSAESRFTLVWMNMEKVYLSSVSAFLCETCEELLNMTNIVSCVFAGNGSGEIHQSNCSVNA